MPQPSGILFAILCVGLVLLLWGLRPKTRSARGPGRIQLWAASAIPPLLVTAMLLLALDPNRFGDLRLKLTGFDIAAPAEGRAGDPYRFSSGGDAAHDDLVVSDTPTGLVEVTPAANGFTVRNRAAPNDRGAMNLATLAAIGSGADTVFAGERPLADGDALCPQGCREGAPRYVFRAWSNRFVRDGAADSGGAELPRRKIAGVSVATWSPTQGIYPLRYYLPADPGAKGPCATVACSKGQPLRSFLFQRPGWSGARWFVVLLDPGAELASKAEAAPEAVALAPGQTRHVALYDVRLKRDSTSDVKGMLVERRSFNVTAVPATQTEPQHLSVRLTTPDIQMIGRCDRAATRLAAQVAPDDFDGVVFPNLGRFGEGSAPAAAASGALPLTPALLCDGMGGTVVAGSKTAALTFRLDRMAPPFFLALIAWVWTIMFHRVSRTCWATNRLDWTLSMLLQFLLAMRIVVGMEGVIADPTLDWRHVYAEVALAYVALPFALAMVRSRREMGLSDTVLLSVVAVTTLLAVELWIREAPDGSAKLMIALVLGSAALRFWGWLPADWHARGKAVLGWARGRAAWVPAPVRRLAARVRPFLADRPSFWIGLLALMAVVRFAMGVGGAKERFFGLAISAVYLPLMLACLAGMTAAITRAEPRRRLLAALCGLAAFGVAALLVPRLVSDNGFVLVHAFPPAVIVAWYVASRRERSETKEARNLRRLFSLPAFGLPILLLGYVAFTVATAPRAPDVPAAEVAKISVEQERKDLAGLLDRAVNESNNKLRIISMLNPAHVRENGGREAENLRLALADLEDRTDTLFGEGYMQPSRLGGLTDVHLSDNVSAVHLMSPFGRVGAFCFLLVLLAAAAHVTGINQPKAKKERDWLNLAGVMAIWTVFAAATYMILANLQMVPFTGRNIYLLAVSSGSDLIEGFVLILIARLGLEKRREGAA